MSNPSPVQFDVASLIARGPSTDDRLAYVKVLVRQATFSLTAITWVTLEWRNQRVLRAGVETERQEITSGWQRMLRSLSASGYLTHDEAAGLPLPLEVETRDLRERSHEPLGVAVR
jgi:hypothetical protein